MDSGFVDLDANMQQRGPPNLDTELLVKQIKVLGKYFDEDREVLAVWEKGEVVAIPVMKENNQQHKIKGHPKK